MVTQLVNALNKHERLLNVRFNGVALHFWHRSVLTHCSFFLAGDYPAPRAVLTGHDHEVVCVSVCAELGLVISGAKGQKAFPSF